MVVEEQQANDSTLINSFCTTYSLKKISRGGCGTATDGIAFWSICVIAFPVAFETLFWVGEKCCEHIKRLFTFVSLHPQAIFHSSRKLYFFGNLKISVMINYVKHFPIDIWLCIMLMKNEHKIK